MTRLAVVSVFVFGLAGCGKLLGIEDLGSSTPGNDGGPRDSNVPGDVMPTQVTFTGSIQLFMDVTTGMTGPAANATVDVLDAQNGSVLGSSGTDSTGKYSVTWFQPGTVDVFLFVKHPQAMDTFHYFAQLQGRDADVSFTMLSPMALQQVAQFAMAQQDPQLGAAIVFAFDANNVGIAGATITADPGKVVYADATGFPRNGATSTDPSGAAWVFNAPPLTNVQIVGPPGTTMTASYPLNVPPMSLSYLPLLLQ
ncbi:MAG TPA: hypothetical protein VFQ53_17140 [Kofleriaceae bacterium]|nr:hypothetical protein [Kofleriaceae bacterium]